LHALRDALGPEVVVARGEEELELSEQSFWCDPRAFAAALDAGRPEEALELCRGGLLTGLHLSEVPEFERWLDEEREHIRRRACETAHTLTDCAQATGNATASVGWARARPPAWGSRARRGWLRRLGIGAGSFWLSRYSGAS